MRFIRILFYCCIAIFAAMFITLSSTTVQKFLLKCCLDIYFKKASVGYCKIGFSDVELKDVSFSSDDTNIRVDALSFKWTPVNVFLKKGLRIYDGSVVASITGRELLNGITRNADADKLEKKLAGFAGSHDFEFAKGPLSYLQAPFKILIDDFYCKISGSFGGNQSLSMNFSINDVKPSSVGTFTFNAKLDFLSKTPLSDVKVTGKGQLYESGHGIFTKLSSNIKAQINRKSAEYSPVIVNVFSEKQSASRGLETTQIDVHYGTSNDLNVSLNFFAGGSTSFSSKWLLHLDHSILKLLGIKELPVLSVMAEGDVRFDRNRKSLENNTYFSTWIKKLDAVSQYLTNVPQLSLKAQLSTTHTNDLIKLNQLSTTLKNKVTKEIFFDANLNHTLTFSSKLCKLLPFKENTKVLDASVAEFPLELLQNFFTDKELRFFGKLAGANFSIWWVENSKNWVVETDNQLVIKEFGLASNETKLLENIDTNIAAKLSVNSSFERFSFDFSGKIVDELNNALIDGTCSGAGTLDEFSVKSMAVNSHINSSISSISKQPMFNSRPALKNIDDTNMSIGLDLEVGKKAILLKNFVTKISENAKTVLTFSSERTLSVDKDNIKNGKFPKINGNLFAWNIDSLNLSSMSMASEKFSASGTLSSRGTVKSDGKVLYVEADDAVSLQNLSLQFSGQSSDVTSFSCAKLEFMPNMSYANDKELNVFVKNLKMFSNESIQTLNGDIEAEMKFDDNKNLSAKANIFGINVSQLLRSCSSVRGNSTLDKFDVVDGLIDITADYSTDLSSESIIKNSKADVTIFSKNGVIKPLIRQSNISKAVSGLSSAFGLLVSARVKEMGSLGFFISYLQAIPYAPIKIKLKKVDDKILIDDTVLMNDEIRLLANGYISADDSKQFIDQAVNLEISMRAKNSNIMKYVAFDTSNVDELGYAIGPKLSLTGTIGSPDYSDFIKLLSAGNQQQSNSYSDGNSDGEEVGVQQIVNAFFNQ